MEFHTPAWVKDAVFYEIFPDRFARGTIPNDHFVKSIVLEPWDAYPSLHGYKGGNLKGITNRLDYLSDIGINALYLTPIFQSASNHRYHTHDYYRVDPLLGGNEALFELLDSAHKKNIRVVLDGVFNHVGRGFFMFNDILENGSKSPYFNWFKVNKLPLHPYNMEYQPNYVCWEGNRALPEFNHDNIGVREFIMEVAEYWLRKGIDGWRLDVPYRVNAPGFWQEFYKRAKAINADAYILAEIIDTPIQGLIGNQFDGVTNYPFYTPTVLFACGSTVCKKNLPQNKDYKSLLPLPFDAKRYARRIQWLLGCHPWETQLSQLNFIGNHDTARIMAIADDDRVSVELAALLMITFPGVPCIYYGDEIGLNGGKDPDCRRGFPPKKNWDKKLLYSFRQLIELRHVYTALRTGNYRVLFAQDYVLVFERRSTDELVIVAVNAGTKDTNVSILNSNTDLVKRERHIKVVYGPGDAKWDDSLSRLVLELPQRSGLIVA